MVSLTVCMPHFLALCYRKQWVKRQRIVHSYGEDEDELDTEELQELDQHMRMVPFHIKSQCALKSLMVLTLLLEAKKSKMRIYHPPVDFSS